MAYVGSADYRQLERLNDQRNEPRTRSAILHDLMDKAEFYNNGSLWREIGNSLIAAYRRDDLSAQVSDHFVNKCPDEVFKDFAKIGPRDKYHNWADRARRF